MSENIRFIHNRDSDDPRMNLALEECCLRHLDLTTPWAMLYVNGPSVIVGRNQNPYQEVSSSCRADKGVPVLRRISGGGTVYHDHGNLNYSFITRYHRKYLNNYRWFTAPVIAALKEMGIDAELNAKNDIAVQGKKISGTAQFSNGKGVLTHGTLLLDASLGMMNRALAADGGAMVSRAVASVRSPVVNIAGLLPAPISMSAFKERIQRAIADWYGGAGVHRPSQEQWDAAAMLAREKYHSWQWNYGRSPKFSVRRRLPSGSGRMEVLMDVDKGRICAVEIQGPLPGTAGIQDIKQRLFGRRYRHDDLYSALAGLDLARYFSGITRTAFVDGLMGS